MPRKAALADKIMRKSSAQMLSALGVLGARGEPPMRLESENAGRQGSAATYTSLALTGHPRNYPPLNVTSS